MDKQLKCKDCGEEFIFSEGEQAFYKEKGFDNEPRYCKSCRASRKMQRTGSDGARENRGGWHDKKKF